MTTCRYNGLDRPRLIRNRHSDDCADDTCRGCLECTESHCLVCGIEHLVGVCPGCVGDAREDLAEIIRMCDDLPAEVVERGVDSDAFDLAGPVADVEAYGHRTMSALMGRTDASWLSTADDLAHPLWALGTAELRGREALGLPEPDGRVTVKAAGAWLDGRLSILAACSDHDWDEMRRDLSACRRYMERVLHDGEQVETGAPCMACHLRLLRVWRGGELPWEHRDGSHPIASEDGWACRRCREWHTEDRYRLAVAQEAHEQRVAAWREADRLTAPQMEAAHGIKPGALTGWASKGLVTKHGLDAEGRMLYDVADVKRVADKKGMMAS